MKKYKVNVNGTEYEVCVELIGDDGRAPAQVATTVSAPAVTTAPAKAEAAAPVQTAQASGDGEAIKAPLQGTILGVNISVGDSIKKGDVVMVLEAMKMENEIMAPRDGKVTGINVQKGAAVDAGATLYTLA